MGITMHDFLPVSTSPIDNRELPVSLDDLKDQLRIEHNDQDRLLLTKIQAATDEVEQFIEGAILHRDFTVYMPRFPGVNLDGSEALVISNPPLVQVYSIEYLDENEVLQTIDSANYRINRAGFYPKLIPTTGNVWPEAFDAEDAVTVKYQAGRAGSPSEVPPAIREAIIIRASSRVEMPVENGVGASSWALDEDLSVVNLLSPFGKRVV